MPADSESESRINAPSGVRQVRSHRATTSTSSLSPLLDAHDWDDAGDSSEANMGSLKDLNRVDSKTHVQGYNEDAPGGLVELNLVETEGSVGFRGLFENPLV